MLEHPTHVFSFNFLLLCFFLLFSLWFSLFLFFVIFSSSEKRPHGMNDILMDGIGNMVLFGVGRNEGSIWGSGMTKRLRRRASFFFF